MEKEMFILDSYEMCKEENTIIFYGRVIEKIIIGDELTYHEQEIKSKHYYICEMMAYGKKFDILDGGMTGALLVKGEKQDFVKHSILTKTI